MINLQYLKKPHKTLTKRELCLPILLYFLHKVHQEFGSVNYYSKYSHFPYPYLRQSILPHP